jgi:hypothetical protein
VNENVILGIVAGGLGLLLLVIIATLTARRDASGPDLGSISPRWLTEHNATRDGTS